MRSVPASPAAGRPVADRGSLSRCGKVRRSFPGRSSPAAILLPQTGRRWDDHLSLALFQDAECAGLRRRGMHWRSSQEQEICLTYKRSLVVTCIRNRFPSRWLRRAEAVRSGRWVDRAYRRSGCEAGPPSDRPSRPARVRPRSRALRIWAPSAAGAAGTGEPYRCSVSYSTAAG